MATQGPGKQLSAEQEALRRRSSEDSTRAPVNDTNPVEDALLRTAHQPEHTAAALEHAHGDVRGRMVSRLQQSHGNSYVQRLVQRSAAAPEAETDEDLAGKIQAQSGGGSSLDPGVQHQLEGGLGADLSSVRVHTDADADHLARSVNSTAFTSGSDIFFREGAYNPGSSEGLHTLAHEAAHTVQQASGPVDGTPSAGGVSVSDPGDRFERAADEAAHTIASGGSVAAPAAASAATSAAVQREEAAPEDEEQKKKPEDELPV
jgi:uncharacterized protein DUF4157